jgi:hypothetical protein
MSDSHTKHANTLHCQWARILHKVWGCVSAGSARAQRPGLPRAFHYGSLACFALLGLSACVANVARTRLRQALSCMLWSQRKVQNQPRCSPNKVKLACK